MTASFDAVPVDRTSWGDLEILFEGSGGPKYCWCMAWRRKPPESRQWRGKERQECLKQLLRDQVDAGTPVGLVGYLDNAPSGWVSVAPRNTYRPLGGPGLRGLSEKSVWSIACFYLQPKLRGRGFTSLLAKAAVDHAAMQGAQAVEAFPADEGSPSYRFMGRCGMFRRLGFKPAGRAGSRRTVMRLALETR